MSSTAPSTCLPVCRHRHEVDGTGWRVLRATIGPSLDRASRHARPSSRGAVAPGMHSSRRSYPHKSAQEVARSSSECAKSCPRQRCSIILEEGRTSTVLVVVLGTNLIVAHIHTPVLCMVTLRFIGWLCGRARRRRRAGPRDCCESRHDSRGSYLCNKCRGSFSCQTSQTQCFAFVC